MSALRKVIRHGFEFLELAPPPRLPVENLPAAQRDIQICEEALATMRRAHAGKGWGEKTKRAKR